MSAECARQRRWRKDSVSNPSPGSQTGHCRARGPCAMIRDAPDVHRRAPGGRPFVDPTQPAIPASAPGASSETGLVRPSTPGVVIASGVILLALAVLALLWTALFFVYGALVTSISSVVQSNPNDFGSINFGPMAEAMRPVLYAVAFVFFCIAT